MKRTPKYYLSTVASGALGAVRSAHRAIEANRENSKEAGRELSPKESAAGVMTTIKRSGLTDRSQRPGEFHHRGFVGGRERSEGAFRVSFYCCHFCGARFPSLRPSLDLLPVRLQTQVAQW